MTNLDSIGASVDYSKSVEEVYTDVAVHELVQRKILLCLANAGISKALENSNPPSWVADWSHDNELKTTIAAGAKFDASRGSQLVLSISEDRKGLKVRGFVLDVVLELNRVYAHRDRIEMDPPLEKEQRSKDLAAKGSIQNGARLSERLHKFPEGQTSVDAYWRTLCCDLTPDFPPSREPEEFGGSYQLLTKFHDSMRNDCTYDFNHEVYKSPEVFRKYLIHNDVLINAVQKFTIARNLCVTAGGYLERLPMGTVISDKICILLGGCVPFVLRDSGEGKFKFIGECYIHGSWTDRSWNGKIQRFWVKISRLDENSRTRKTKYKVPQTFSLNPSISQSVILIFFCNATIFFLRPTGDLVQSPHS